MKRILLIVAVVCFGSISAEAQYGNESMRPAAARATIDKTLTEEVVEAARPLNSKLDYIAATYDAGDLRALIKNYEKTNKKIAARQGKTYVPYDRKINVEDPQKVKRCFHKRVDIIF